MRHVVVVNRQAFNRFQKDVLFGGVLCGFLFALCTFVHTKYIENPLILYISVAIRMKMSDRLLHYSSTYVQFEHRFMCIEITHQNYKLSKNVLFSVLFSLFNVERCGQMFGDRIDLLRPVNWKFLFQNTCLCDGYFVWHGS